MRSLNCTIAALLTALVTSAWTAAAEPQTFDQSRNPGEETSSIERYDPGNSGAIEPAGRPLSLQEAIGLGLRNNLDVEVNRYTPYVSQLDAEGAWGAYDVNFSGQVGYSEDVPAPAGTSIFNIGKEGIQGDVGLKALIPYIGATAEIVFNGSKTESDPTAPALIFPLNPQKDSSLTFSGSIPLMKGLIWNQAWTQVKASRLAYEGELETFTTSVMDTVSDIIKIYWKLIANKEQQRVAEKSLESNVALLDQTKTQYEVGVVSKVDVVQAEAGVANSEFNLIVAKNNYRNTQDELIAAVLGDRIRAGTVLLFDPTDNPIYHSVEAVDLEKAVETAFQKRPELKAVEKDIGQGELQLRFAKNQRLPQLDLNASYTALGVAGTINVDPPAPPPNQLGGKDFVDTFDSYFGDPRGVKVGAVVSIPLGNVTARKNVSKARIQLRRANTLVTRLRQQIIVNVRVTARTRLAAAQGVEAAERRRIAAAEQLRAETIRLEHGESTPFDVLQRERDLVEAESQKIDALQAFRNAEVDLERAQGTILEARNISIEGVREMPQY
jgi:outer membrane protein TolC